MNRTEDFRVTYDIVTPESAEDRDIAENGFILGDGSYVGAGDWEVWQSVGMTLRAAIKLIGCVENGGNRSYVETDGRQDYSTGRHETRTLHLPGDITSASQRRVECMLRKERLL